MGTAAADRLSAAELAAIRAVYRAGLGPGSTRAELVAADLVNRP
jgi:hypothetical protein